MYPLSYHAAVFHNLHTECNSKCRICQMDWTSGSRPYRSRLWKFPDPDSIHNRAKQRCNLQNILCFGKVFAHTIILPQMKAPANPFRECRCLYFCEPLFCNAPMHCSVYYARGNSLQLLLHYQTASGAVSFFLRFGRRTSVVPRTPTMAPPKAASAR